MKSNSISNLIHVFKIPHSAFRTPHFHQVAWLTFIVYFITSFCGYFNFFLARFSGKVYFPLKSYLISFDKNNLSNISEFEKTIYNISGYKAIINTNIPYKILDDLFFTIIATSLIILFFIGYKIIQSNKISQIEIIKWSIIFSLLMVFALPSHSSDLFGYIARGAQQSLYNQNPYHQTVSEIKDYRTNPLFINFMWPDQLTSYGPVFVYFTKAIVCLSNNNLILSFINFKLLNFTLFLLATLFTLKTNDTKNVYLISWNPLIMLQGLWNCHNDLLSGVLIFFGLYLLLKEKYFWSIFCLTVSSGVKYIPLLIIPIIFFYLLKNNSKRESLLHFVLGICCGIILIAIFSADYLSPTREIAFNDINKILKNINLEHKSLIATLLTLIKYFCHSQKINYNPFLVLNTIKLCFYFLFGIFYFIILLKKKSNVIFDITLVLLIFLGFILTKFQSWYLLNLIILIPLLEENILKKILIAISTSHTYAITFLDQAKILNFISMTLLPILYIFWKEKRKK